MARYGEEEGCIGGGIVCCRWSVMGLHHLFSWIRGWKEALYAICSGEFLCCLTFAWR